jgi:hypothetical protein
VPLRLPNESVLTLYRSKDKERLLLFHVDKWEASAIPRFSTIRYEVFYSFLLQVYDKEGNQLASSETHDVTRREENQLASNLKYLQRLDIEMIDSILEPDRTYQDFEKPIFIHNLGIALDEFLQAGDTYLNCYPGKCNAEICNYKCKGFRFIGVHSGNYFNLIIDIKDGVVHDIYECNEFKCVQKTAQGAKRVMIDQSEFPF